MKTVVDVQKTDIILNDTLWEIHPSKVVIDSGKIYIDDFYFSHKDRYLRINGTISKQPQDTVRLDLKDINIGYVFDIALTLELILKEKLLVLPMPAEYWRSLLCILTFSSGTLD